MVLAIAGTGGFVVEEVCRTDHWNLTHALAAGEIEMINGDWLAVVLVLGLINLNDQLECF